MVHLNFSNGWTISLADGVTGGLANVAAWPTADPAAAAKDYRWFRFSDGREDARAYSLEEMFARIAEVAAAAPPAELT
jgi:hypothetical protein